MKTSELLLLFLLTAILGYTTNLEAAKKDKSGEKRATPVAQAIAALRTKTSKVTIQDKERTKDLTWVEVKLYEETQTYPMTIDIMATKKTKPTKIIYLLTASSLNFKSSFFTPKDKSLAKYMAKNGYLVVGITPREDNVPIEADPSVMKEWGLTQHRTDIRKIIELIQPAIKKPYDMLGHSLGATSALDYAARFSDQMEKVMILEFPSINPLTQPNKTHYAALAYSAYDQLISAGVYADYSVTQLKGLLEMSSIYPDIDSGVDRSLFGLPGNFTLNGLAHFSLIYTAYLPGTITPLTGLPQEWPMILSNLSGYYDFYLNPQEDSFGFFLTDINTALSASQEIGSGATPLAFLQDYTAMMGNLPSSEINWSDIDEEVIWINGEIGMGTQTYGAELIEAAGNKNVSTIVVPGYGHIDVIFSSTATDDVWSLFLK